MRQNFVAHIKTKKDEHNLISKIPPTDGGRNSGGYWKNHPINRPDITCFTSKIKCVHCGCNFRRSTQSSTKSSDGKRHYWRCAERKWCDTVGLREDFLKPFLAKVLDINEFDDDIFKERIDHIEVLSTTDLTIYFKDGRKISRVWKNERNDK
ncbi:MAG: zinc ribbon domain-containing protein [Selenomonadaceae bacterium]|nr:zinc ribbon domain-containing protein [Selenomonadaceae bacterium]